MRGARGTVVASAVLLLASVPQAVAGSAPDTGAAFDPVPRSQALYDVKAPAEDPEHQVHRVAAGDGVDLYVETWLPKAKDGNVPPARVPVIVLMSPYEHPGERPTYDVYSEQGGHPELAPVRWFVTHGYAFAIHHVRGSGGSGGCLEQTGPNQIDDGARVIEYLGRDAPFSNGRVGAYGISYDAETQLSVAGLGAPQRTRYLKAIVPSQVIANQYEYVHGDGVPLTAHGPLNVTTYVGYSLQGGGAPLPSAVDASPLLGYQTHAPDPARTLERLACQPDLLGAYTDPSGDWNDFWESREYRVGAGRIRAATLYVGGHRDFTTTQSAVGLLDHFSDSTPLKVIIGQWEHAFPDMHDVEADWARTDWLPLVTLWYDRWLKRIHGTGVTHWPSVQVQDPTGRWRAEDAWPRPSAPIGQLALGPGGLLGATAPTGRTSYDEISLIEPCGVDCGLDSGTFATFTTPQVGSELHLAGEMLLDLWVVLVQPDAHIGAFLDVLGPDGSVVPLRSTFGLRSARHLDALADGRFAQRSGRDAPVGVPLRIPIRIEPNDLVVPDGGRLRLRIAGSVMDGLPSGALGSVTILHDCAHPSALRFRMPRPRAHLLNVREVDDPPGPLASTLSPHLEVTGGGLATAAVCGR